ncbi:TPA: hypothetical protein DDW35_09135 [Candidatus Sumerlaeota bacterium]|jgi:hypothetical protein|nr:hypothetical protein [Candidatus Sumerlaeota bacterium]
MLRFVLPSLLTVALLCSAIASNRHADGLGWLHLTHMLSVVAAGFTFWKRPVRSHLWQLPDTICVTLWGILFAWTLFNQRIAGASQTTYPYFVTLLDAALLFYAARQAAFHHARLTLLVLVGGHLILLLGTRLHLHVLETISSTLLTAVFVLFGALALLFSILPIAQHDAGALRFNLPRPPAAKSSIVWTFALICLVGFCIVLGVSRGTFHNRRIDLQAQVIDFPRQAQAPQLVRENLRRQPIEGVGLGLFEPFLRGSGIFFVPVSQTPVPPNLFPQHEADYLRKVLGDDQPALGLSHALPSWYSEPRSIHSYQMFAVEIGLLGMAFGLVAILFLTCHTIQTISDAPRTAQSIFTLAVLATWVAILMEGFLGIALHKYQGILLVSALSGYLWGITSVLRDHPATNEETAQPVLPAPVQPFSWKRFAPVGIVAFLLLLVMVQPAYNAHMLNSIRRDRTDSTAYTYASAALEQNPFLEETYALLIRFHQERHEPEKMGFILDKATARCPASPLLVAWRMELSRMIDQPLVRIPQLAEAARSVSALRPELQPFYLRECAEELEKLSRFDDSLEIRRRLFLLNPTDKDARTAYERAAKLADNSSTKYQ